MEKIGISIISNNANWCSGSCSYCHASNDIQGIDYSSKESIINNLKTVDDRTYEEFNADYGKLEKLLDDYISHVRKNVNGRSHLTFEFWGADPIGCFLILQENVDFCKWYCKEKGYDSFNFFTSTNGLSLLRPEVREYLNKEHIRFQISHDGLGQWFRTREFDPFDYQDDLKDVSNLWSYINCVQNYWNADIEKNINYFNERLFNFPRVNIQTVFVRQANYNITDRNELGLLNGEQIEALKGVPWVDEKHDLSIRNDWELAHKYGVWQLAHQADLYFHQLEMIYRNLASHRYDRFRGAFVKRIMINGMEVSRDSTRNRSSCSSYHKGLIPYSFTLDTTGRYSECHVLDADHHVEDPNMEGQEWCKSCKYYNRHLCFECGCLSKNNYSCQFLYRYNQMIDRVKGQPRLYEYITSMWRARNAGNISQPKQQGNTN